MQRLHSPFVHIVLLSAALLTGCAPFQSVNTLKPQTKPGRVRGGQQPVSGATIQVYAVGTANDGSAATPLLSPAVKTDANGEFTLPNGICPSPSTLVYIVATGGNPGLAPGTNNAALSLMAAIGPCSNMTSTSFININELTTVAAVWALAPYMSSYSAIGSASANAGNLANAFTLASEFANYSTGTVPGLNLPAGVTVPMEQINTLADILAACVNSAGGVAGDGSVCGTLFSATTPAGGVAPTDVIGSGINIADNPSSNIPTLFGLSSSFAPYQPTLTSAPTDYSVQLTPVSSGVSASSASLTFPNEYISFSSTPLTLTLTNTGTATIKLNSINIVGADAPDFSAPGPTACSQLLFSTQSCVIHVIFTPSSAGPRTASLTVSNSTTVSPLSFALSGTGIAGSGGPVTLSPSSLTFNLAGVSQMVTVTNSGTTPVTIGNISTSDSYSALQQTNNCGSTLEAQSICNVFVQTTFLPVSSYTGTLKVVDSAASAIQTIPINVPASNVTFNTTPISFGSWALGVTSATQTVLFLGSGSAETPISPISLSVTGPDAGDFSNIAGSPLPGEYQVIIAFTPHGIGTRTATLITNYGDVSLSGSGAPAGPSFTISPYSSSSSMVNMSTTSTLTVVNNGSVQLLLTGASVTGANAGDFAVTNNCAGTLHVSASCSVNVVFTPSQTGMRSATLTLTDGTSGASEAVTLSGFGYPDAPTVSSNTVTFSNTQVGSSSASQIVTVTAPNGDPVTFPPSSIYDSDPNDFLLSTGACATQTPCQLTVTFKPTATGFRQGGVLVTDSVTLQATTIVFSGTGGVASVSLSTPSLTFAARNTGTISIPQTITLTNTGNLSLAISGVMFIGVNPGDFSLQGNTCGSSVAAGATCTISVSFAPTASGARTAALEILTNAASSPDTVQLSGTGN